MSTYYCSCCDSQKDADFDGVNEHPNEAFGDICDICYDRITEHYEAPSDD